MKITLWQWVCGVRVRQLDLFGVIELQNNGLITQKEARDLLVRIGILLTSSK
jgi:hypothetical protein